MSSQTEIKIPDIGDFTEVEVIELLVAEGDQVAQEDPLLTLESDKATMEIPSPAAGIIKSLQVAVGDKVSEGSVVMLLQGDASADPENVAEPSSAEVASSSTETVDAQKSSSPSLVIEPEEADAEERPSHSPPA